MTPALEERLALRRRTLDRVRELLITRLRVSREPDEIDPDTPLFGTGLGLDSVDAVELVFCVEQTFGVRLAEDAGAHQALRTVDCLVDYVLAAEKVVP